MDDKFGLIKKEYDQFYRDLLKSGSLPMRDTGKGFWSAAISSDIFDIFKKIKLQTFRNFLDIGSGDGVVVSIASLFTSAAGIEIDPALHKKALEMQKKLSVNARLINDDFYSHDFSRYDILFLNPDRPLHRGLEQKLLRELKGKLILYGPHFRPSQLKKEREFFVNDTMVSVYSKF